MRYAAIGGNFMSYVLITAAGIALCSLIGAAAGFLFENIPQCAEEALSGAAAGIMLCAAVLCLIAPALELSAGRSPWLTPSGVLCGAFFLGGTGLLAPRTAAASDPARRHALLLTAAIAIHHFPEGIAAGVSFGTGDLGGALTVAGGIAFQNVPEAMVIIPPLLKSGAGRRAAAAAAVISSAVEVAGVFFGYAAVSLSRGLLPFTLAFAAGSMLYVIGDGMLPRNRLSACSMLLSFSLFLAAL